MRLARVKPLTLAARAVHMRSPEGLYLAELEPAYGLLQRGAGLTGIPITGPGIPRRP
jgi:hypothetical protein